MKKNCYGLSECFPGTVEATDAICSGIMAMARSALQPPPFSGITLGSAKILFRESWILLDIVVRTLKNCRAFAEDRSKGLHKWGSRLGGVTMLRIMEYSFLRQKGPRT